MIEVITPEGLIKLGFKKDEYSDDRFEFDRNGVSVELSGYDAVGDYGDGDKRVKGIQPSQYALTADCGMIPLSRPFTLIAEVQILITILTGTE